MQEKLNTAILRLLFGVSIALTGCEFIIGIEDTIVQDANSDPQTSFAVHGTAYGVLEKFSLNVEHNNGSTSFDVETDGPFTFPIPLQNGALYSISLVDEPPCVLNGDTNGLVSDDNPVIELVCEGALQLAKLTLSGPTSPDIEVEQNDADYTAETSLLQEYVSVIAASVYPLASLSVENTIVTNGAASMPIPLELGENILEVQVTISGLGQRTHRVFVHRVIEIAQTAYVKASNTGRNDEFGLSVSVSGDTLVVGTRYESSAATGIDGDQENDDAENSGAAYVFRYNGANWVQEAYLKASNADISDRFGVSLSISGDTLAVGAQGESGSATGINGDQGDGGVLTGAVYVFQRNGTTWTQEAYIKASNTGNGDRFGLNVALSGDTLAVCAYGESSSATGVNGDQSSNAASESGAVYIFRRSDTGWAQEAYLKASNTEAGDWFGSSVALLGDLLAVGATGEASASPGINGDQNDNSAPSSGAVYIFRRTETGWAQEAYIKASNPGSDDEFGRRVALSGNILAVGAHTEDSGSTGINGAQDDESAVDSGAVYIFRLNGTLWAQEAYLKASNTGSNDQFGIAIALSGEMLAVGAVGEESAATGIHGNQGDNSSSGSGAVYLYRRKEAGWDQSHYIKPSNTGEGDSFGISLAFARDSLAIGAIGESSATTGVNGNEADNSAEDSGAVYLFH